MASSNSSAARKKPGAKLKKTADTVAANAAPKKEGKKEGNVASTEKVVSISEISKKNAEPGKLTLWAMAIKNFLKSVRSEMGRVTWPSWKELRLSTVVVIVTLLLVSMYMGVVDWLLSLVFGTPSTGF